MPTLSARPLSPTFLPSLNTLLAALSLPFTLDHPSDLTPSLLLAIFESLISARLPIPLSVRQSRTRDAKTRAMLVLLGVLECDVLRGGTANAEHSVAVSNADDSALAAAGAVSVDGWVDEIGLGEVDPERLADGGWEETIFVGELLCWLARRRGILPRSRSSRQSSSRQRSMYLNHHSYGTEGGEDEGNTVDFSTSLLLRPSSSFVSRSPPLRSPPPSNRDVGADADYSIHSSITDVPRHPLVHSPEPSVSASATTGTDLSIRARTISSRTSVSNTHDEVDEFQEASQNTLQMYDPVRMMQDAEEDDDLPPSFRPRCIHELEDPSYIRVLGGPSSSFDPVVSHDIVSEDGLERDVDDELDNDDLYAPPTPTPRRVRLTGWIEPVDAATELSHFTTSRLSRPHAFHTSPGSDPGPPASARLHKHSRTGDTFQSTSLLKTERSGSSKPRQLRPASPSPPPSSPPTSPPLPTTSSRYLAKRLSSPPSPPSPHGYSDVPFDISFSNLNNTSTPAKPRMPQRRQYKAETETHVRAGLRESGASTEGHSLPRRRDRSPSYTPSPPSFSTPGDSRSGSSNRSSGTNIHVGASSSSTTTAAVSRKIRDGSALSSTTISQPFLTSGKGKSPPGSTATTNTLLTERARLLTELAALKRIRTAINTDGAMNRTGSGMGNGGGPIGQHVGVLGYEF